MKLDLKKIFFISLFCAQFICRANGATSTTAATVTSATTSVTGTTATATATTATTAGATTTTAAAALAPVGTITDNYGPPIRSQALFNQLVALFGPTAAFNLLYGVSNAANNFAGSYYINTIGTPSSGGIVQTTY